MKIIINLQILNGNMPEGFKISAWCDDIESEYRRICLLWFPAAEIVVKIDRQNASGYSRPISVDFDDDDDVSAIDQQSLIAQIESAELDAQDYYD